MFLLTTFATFRVTLQLVFLSGVCVVLFLSLLFHFPSGLAVSRSLGPEPVPAATGLPGRVGVKPRPRPRPRSRGLGWGWGWGKGGGGGRGAGGTTLPLDAPQVQAEGRGGPEGAAPIGGESSLDQQGAVAHS